MTKTGPLLFLAFLLALLLPGLLLISWPFLTSFLVAAILAIAIHPANQWLCRRIRTIWLATFLTTLTTVLVLGGLFALAGIALIRELNVTYDALSVRSLEEGGWPALVTNTTERIVDGLATRLPLDKDAIRTELVDGMRTATGYLLNNIGSAVGGATTLVITGMLTTLFLYYLLRHGEAWTARFAALLPLDPLITAGLLETVHRSVVANVNGVLAVAVGQGLFLALGFGLVGLRSPTLWGAIGGLASIIPAVGSPMVWLPAVIGLLFLGSYWKALFLALWGALVVGSIDNLLRSFVVGAGDKQHPVLIALAAIGGTYAFGILGILLGPLVVSLAAAVLLELQKLFDSRPVATADPDPQVQRRPG